MIRQLLADEWRFLTFRRMSAGVRERPWAYIAFGLAFTWLAGIGRYWDNPRADWWQYAGLGSVAYVLLLSTLLWLLIAPLRPRHGSLRNVLMFVVLTAPPAVLYAIPVERFLSVDAAVAANQWFLAIVATWRVALYLHFLLRTAALPIATAIVATLLPLIVIVITLAVLNLEHVVFDIMAGIRDEDRGPNDGAYLIVFTLTMMSGLAAPFVLIGYLLAVWHAWVIRPRNAPP